MDLMRILTNVDRGDLHADNIPVLRLADKFSDYPKISERALGVGDTHNPVHAIIFITKITR